MFQRIHCLNLNNLTYLGSLGKHVTGWDDCRMPTLNGLRRRGYPPEAIQKFCELIGVTRNQNLIKFDLLEHCCR